MVKGQASDTGLSGTPNTRGGIDYSQRFQETLRARDRVETRQVHKRKVKDSVRTRDEPSRKETQVQENQFNQFSVYGEASSGPIEKPEFRLYEETRKPFQEGLIDFGLNIASIGVAGKTVVEELISGKDFNIAIKRGSEEATEFVTGNRPPDYKPFSSEDILRKAGEIYGFASLTGGAIKSGGIGAKPLSPPKPNIINVPKDPGRTGSLPSNLFAKDTTVWAKAKIGLGAGAIKKSSIFSKTPVSLGESSKTITSMPMGKGPTRFLDRGGSAGLPSSGGKGTRPPTDSPPSKTGQVLQSVTKQEQKGSAQYIKLGEGKGQLIKQSKSSAFTQTQVSLGKGKSITKQKTRPKQDAFGTIVVHAPQPAQPAYEQVIRTPEKQKTVLIPQIDKPKTNQIITAVPVIKSPPTQKTSSIPKQPPRQITTTTPKIGTPFIPDTIIITPPRPPVQPPPIKPPTRASSIPKPPPKPPIRPPVFGLPPGPRSSRDFDSPDRPIIGLKAWKGNNPEFSLVGIYGKRSEITYAQGGIRAPKKKKTKGRKTTSIFSVSDRPRPKIF